MQFYYIFGSLFVFRDDGVGIKLRELGQPAPIDEVPWSVRRQAGQILARHSVMARWYREEEGRYSLAWSCR